VGEGQGEGHVLLCGLDHGGDTVDYLYLAGVSISTLLHKCVSESVRVWTGTIAHYFLRK
jgi:hypothetical protein